MLQILVKMVKNLEKRAVTWWPPIPIPIPVSIAIAIAFATPPPPLADKKTLRKA